MSGLPPGAAMYYDVPPQYDSRHTRTLVKETAKIIQEFVQAHGMGRDHPDVEFKKTANEARSQLEAKRLEMSYICNKFDKKENQEKVAAQIGKLQMTLDGHPPFDIPSPVALDPDLAHRFLNRIGQPVQIDPRPTFPIVVGPPPLQRMALPILPALPPPPPPSSAVVPVAPQQLIAFSDASRTSGRSRQSDAGKENTGALIPSNTAPRRLDPLDPLRTESSASNAADDESSVASSRRSNKTSHSVKPIDEEPPASLAVDGDRSQLRIRYEELMRKKQQCAERSKQKEQRYEQEARLLAQ